MSMSCPLSGQLSGPAPGHPCAAISAACISIDVAPGLALRHRLVNYIVNYSIVNYSIVNYSIVNYSHSLAPQQRIVPLAACPAEHHILLGRRIRRLHDLGILNLSPAPRLDESATKIKLINE